MSYPPLPSTWQTPAKVGQQEEHSQFSHQENNYRMVFSQEELRVLRECNRESFYYRCIPLATLFNGLAYIGMKRGYLRTNSQFGYWPKIVGASIMGYIMGKFSYQSVCVEKLMRLPNSRVGEMLRKRKGQLSFQESLAMEPGFSYAAPSSESQQESVFDERRPDLSEHEEGIDSYQKVQESLSPYSESDELSLSPSRMTTYEELRRENREEYSNKLTEKYKKEPTEPPPSSAPSSFPGSGSGFSDSPHPRTQQPDIHSREPPPKPEPYFNPKKNKYGDVWDD